MQEIQEKLEMLHLTETVFNETLQNVRSEMEQAILDLLGQETFDQMEALKARYSADAAEISQRQQSELKALHDEVKAAVLEHGQTVKGQHYMAVYAQPKPSWDNSKLEGFALVHPQVLECRTEKPPYVSLRKVK
jgi:hypothetical protein